MIHIHNGDVVAALAKRAGIPGEHLPFRESFVSGPLPPRADLEARARHIAESHGENLLRVRTDLLEQEAALTRAAAEEEVVLWFEHDLYCLAHFLYMLDRFANVKRLTAIWSANPLAHEPEEEIHLMFDSRAAVTPSLLAIGREAWRAFTAPDATALNSFLAFDRADFPFLRDGLRLHASRFPSLRNGLGSIENKLLGLIAPGAIDFATLFPLVDPEPPRFGFGDGEVMRILWRLANRPVPLITITEAEEGAVPPKALFNLTPAAANVINGVVDDVAINEPDHWLGGAHLTRENLWRWDETRKLLVRNRSAA